MGFQKATKLTPRFGGNYDGYCKKGEKGGGMDKELFLVVSFPVALKF